MARFEGFISKKVVKAWLETYEYMIAGDRPPDALPGNSGPKSADGIKAGFLNRVMLEQAIESLSPLTKACCKARWVHKLPRKQVLDTLGISKEVYYNRCDQAIEEIYQFVNGGLLPVKNLVEAITVGKKGA